MAVPQARHWCYVVMPVCFPARCYGGGWFGAVDAGTAAAVQNFLPHDLAVLALQFRVQVGVELVDDGSELVDEFPHRQRSFSPLQDEEDRSQMELDVALDGVREVGLDLGVQGALQNMLRDGHDGGRFVASAVSRGC